MIKNSVKKKERDWDWRRIAVPEAVCTAGKRSTMWGCRKYAVWVTRFPDDTVLLSIYDHACRHSWWDMQRIKNEVLGEHWAAVEVYPPQRLVVDEANLYHLWCTQEQLRIGWDDAGQYTVGRMFYGPMSNDPQLNEAAMARLLAGSHRIIDRLLEADDSEASLRPTRLEYGP